MKIKKAFPTSIVLSLVLLLLDQFLKYIIRREGGFYICNKGVAFGISLPEKFIWTLSLIIIFSLILLLFKKTLLKKPILLGLILAGAFSNLIDRLYFACVIDFIDLRFWPVFNLADVYITVGVIILLYINLNHRTRGKD